MEIFNDTSRALEGAIVIRDDANNDITIKYSDDSIILEDGGFKLAQEQTAETIDDDDFITKKYADETYGKASGDFPLTEDQVEFPLIIKEEKEYDVVEPFTGLDTHSVNTYIVGKNGIDGDTKWANGIVERGFPDEDIESICEKMVKGAGVVIDLNKIRNAQKPFFTDAGIAIDRYVFKITSVTQDGNTYTANLGGNTLLNGVKIIAELGKRVNVKFPVDIQTGTGADVGIDSTDVIANIGTLEGTPTGKKVLAIADEALEDWEFTINGSPVVKKVIVLDK